MSVSSPTWMLALHDSGGIARQAALIELGARKHELARAVARRRLVRVRRSWLALPDADPLLVSAARAGVVLTCVTRAKRLGLWVTAEDRPHVAAPVSSGGVRIERQHPGDTTGGELKATVHWCTPLVQREPHVLEDSLENTLVIVARCQPRERALAVWDSALNKGLVEKPRLARLPLPAFARAVLEEATPFADSGLESFVPRRLRWMNVRLVAQAWILGRPVDFLIGERLVLQVDGGHHVGPQRDADVKHDAELLLLGYHVIRVGYWQVINDWPAVQQLIMTAVAQGLHRAR
jgi:very-short-patch-repair endonuclease